MYLLLAAFLSVGTPLPLSFEATIWTNYGDALSSARSTEKPLVVVLEDLSRPSERVKQVRGHASILRANAEFCIVDVSTAYGRKVAESYRATKFPYTVVTDRNCRRILYRRAGRFTDSAWASVLARYIPQPTARPADLRRADPAAPQFDFDDLELAQRSSQLTGTPLLVFVSMKRCGYCDKMNEEIFSQPEQLEQINDRYETVKVLREDYEDFVAENGVRIYPSVLLFDGRGQLIDRIDGYQPPDRLRTRLKHSRAARLTQS